MKLGLRRLILLMVGAQAATLALWIALTDMAEYAPPPRPVRPRRTPSTPPPDPRVTVPWQGSA